MSRKAWRVRCCRGLGILPYGFHSETECVMDVFTFLSDVKCSLGGSVPAAFQYVRAECRSER